MESAIAPHLVCPRNRERRIGDDYKPVVPAWTARGELGIDQVVMAYLGVQWRGDGLRPKAIRRLGEIDRCMQSGSGPSHHDFAHYVDEAGFDNFVVAAYWTDNQVYKEWCERPEFSGLWNDICSNSDGLGHFREILSPRVQRFETLFSTPDTLEGIGVALGEHSGEEIQEHAYWGGARDRIPLSQTDALDPIGSVTKLELSDNGTRVRIGGHKNIALIRSGQDWTTTKGRERKLYVDEIKPTLTAGMTYLRDRGGEVGCYVNRFLTHVDSGGVPQEKTFGLSYWHSLADMEKWAEHHPTHLQIFGTFMTTVQALDFQLDLRLYHEVCVLAEDEQDYEYVNCHGQTGLMNALA
jgi:aldoxime dehydratase